MRKWHQLLQPIVDHGAMNFLKWSLRIVLRAYEKSWLQLQHPYYLSVHDLLVQPLCKWHKYIKHHVRLPIPILFWSKLNQLQINLAKLLLIEFPRNKNHSNFNSFFSISLKLWKNKQANNLIGLSNGYQKWSRPVVWEGYNMVPSKPTNTYLNI